MTSSLARRIFLAHLELSYRLGRKVTLAEFGHLIANEMGRDTPFTAAAVSRWEKGTQIPSPRVIEAIASLTGIDPGWLSHGDKTAAPGPRSRVQEPASSSPAAEHTHPADDQAAHVQPAEDEQIREKRRSS
jgi:transcriptional regulator with XRE-family HTH domain